MTYNNNSSQKERRQVLANDRANIGKSRDASSGTFHQFAQSEAGEVQGRWAKPAQVTGSEGAVHMPRLPENSPWAAPDPSGQEPPLNIDVTEAPITGEPFEVEASQQPFSWMRDRPSPLSCSAGSAGGDDVAAAPTSSSAAPSTSLLKPRAASEGGATNSSNQEGGRGRSAPSSKLIRRRLI
jgi:hypothetical protein